MTDIDEFVGKIEFEMLMKKIRTKPEILHQDGRPFRTLKVGTKNLHVCFFESERL